MTLAFPQFSQLPLELQRIIWEIAARQIEPGVCIFPGLGCDGEVLLPLGVNLRLPPALLHICRESRAESLKHVRLEQDSQGALSRVWREFSFDADTLFVPDRHMLGFLGPNLDRWAGAAKIRSLTFEYTFSWGHFDTWWLRFRLLVSTFKRLRRVGLSHSDQNRGCWGDGEVCRLLDLDPGFVRDHTATHDGLGNLARWMHDKQPLRFDLELQILLRCNEEASQRRWIAAQKRQ
ncbi:hypothetical protein F4778DRAFT_291537 [Xylariomycetidae sp. FL2044]|nr:hypothetical protein F4778DRAFT_291537 [Xylariomycetidae sp. FL2044]